MNEPRSADSGYERVRAALRAQGYLETPLERAFLGLGPRSGLRQRLQGALLTGLLGGPILGLLLSASLLLGSDGTIPLWPDGLLYAALFAPVLGAILGVAEAVISWIVSISARIRGDVSPRRAALWSGLGVAIAIATYLGAWWALAGGPAQATDLLALALLALGAGLVGRIVSAAVLIQASLSAGRAPNLRKPRFVGWLAILAVAAVIAGAMIAPLFDGGAGQAPVEQAADAPRRSVLVGWDGLSADLARGLIRRGELQWTGELWNNSRRALLEKTETGDPVSLWTTIATGCSAEDHGMTGVGLLGLAGTAAPAPRGGLTAGPMEFLLRLLPTRERVARSGLRSIPALWEYSGDRVKTVVVGWWATWPAVDVGPAGGYVVSDGALVAARRQRGIEQAVLPATWGEGHAPVWLASARDSASHALGYSEVGEDQPFALARLEALEADLFTLEALADALQDPDVGVATVYLPGLDILRERGARRGSRSFPRARRRGDARRHHRPSSRRDSRASGRRHARAGDASRTGRGGGVGPVRHLPTWFEWILARP